jgi:poly-gamma-glutamate synthesis protein (capsule biosynthesis protein)
LNDGPPEQPWQVNLLDINTILAKARAARADGADLVVVAVHAGTEYNTEPNTDQVTAAHTLLASPDIDLVYGHHAHVVQPLQKINGKWVIYGLGNNIAAQDPRRGHPPRPARPGLRDLGAHRTRPRRHRG